MKNDFRLLAVEDSEDDFLLLLRELKRGGYHPVHERVETAVEMRDALQRGPWGLVVSDYIMPQFTGLAALDVLKETGLDIPFIIVSGKIGEDIAVEAMKAGALDYIVKGNLARLVPAGEREIREAEARRKRRAVEAELRASEDRFRAIAATATDAIIIIDHRGNISYWNPAAARIFGYSEQEAIGSPLHIFVVPQTLRKPFEQGFLSFTRTGQGPAVGNVVELVAKKKSGDEFPVEVSLSALQSGSEWHAVGIIRDITERKRAEEELRKHRDHLEDLVRERTLALQESNERLEIEIAERRRIEEELRQHRDHLDHTVREKTAELRKANKDLRAEIMRRISMEKDLIESQRFVQRIADATPNLLYLYDVQEDRNIYLNQRVYEILGYTPEEVRKMGGAFIRTILHPDDGPVIDDMWERISGTRDGDIVETEFRLRNSKGEWRWFYSRDVVFKRMAGGRMKLILGIAQDITERKEAEEELRNSREQLRILLGHLQMVREEERTRISREIHDELGQSLTALKMDISWLMRRFGKDEKLLIDKAKMMSKLIDLNIQTVKRISAELRPGLLDDLGIAAALEWQAEEFQERTGMRCIVKADPEITLDRNRSTALFRIFQETMTNVVRHSLATQVKIILRKNRNHVVLKVEDNGKGITKKQIASPKSIGLIGMRERVEYFGGKLSIAPGKDKGTVVTVNILLEDSLGKENQKAEKLRNP